MSTLLKEKRMKLKSRALLLAIKAHKNQHRKVTNEPFVTHPVKTALLVEGILKYDYCGKGSKHIIAAAYLHDVLEDTGTTINEIITTTSRRTASIVKEVSNSKDDVKTLGKLEAQTKQLSKCTDEALLVKLCDITSNAEDAPATKWLKDKKVLLDRLKDRITKAERNEGLAECLRVAHKKAREAILKTLVDRL